MDQAKKLGSNKKHAEANNSNLGASIVYKGSLAETKKARLNAKLCSPQWA